MADFLRDMSLEQLQELQAEIQQEIDRRGPALWVRCHMCSGTGRRDEGYCICPLGKDLRRIERSSDYEISGEL